MANGKKEETMIELDGDELQFSFPEVHHFADMSISFQQTLRIPDDGTDYPLPPGFRDFPLVHVDDYSENVPYSWIEHGGVMLPMYQSEGLWTCFSGRSHQKTMPECKGKKYKDSILQFPEYPFAIKVATGKINALTGDLWNERLQKDPQDYMVSTEQPWLDGYCVEKGIIRQFVAMPLGAGYTAEEQLTGGAQYGGLQIIAYPMKKESYERLFPPREKPVPYSDECNFPIDNRKICSVKENMGLAPGGRMKQGIFQDPFSIDDWDMDHKSRCFVHIVNSLMWKAITGKNPPNLPLLAVHYEYYGLPWFEYYDENAQPIDGSKKLETLKSVVEMGKEKDPAPLPENESVEPKNIVELFNELANNQVREGTGW
jgi:hypothetical protein